jgi:hypothetical protein
VRHAEGGAIGAGGGPCKNREAAGFLLVVGRTTQACLRTALRSKIFESNLFSLQPDVAKRSATNVEAKTSKAISHLSKAISHVESDFAFVESDFAFVECDFANSIRKFSKVLSLDTVGAKQTSQ